MIISHKHKFIFVHPHRCGGTSVTRALLPYLGTKDEVYGCEKEYEILSEENRVKNIDCDGNEQGKNPWKHSTVKWIKEYTGKKIWDTYFKFVFVRNPWEINYSFFHWWKRDEGWDPEPRGYEEKKAEIDKLGYGDYLLTDLAWEYTLIDFLKCDFKEDKIKDPFANGESIMNLEVDVDFIARCERIKVDFAYICGRLKLPNIKLDRTNESRPIKDRKFHLDEIVNNGKARKHLCEKHARDSRYLGYSENFKEYDASWNNYMC